MTNFQGIGIEMAQATLKSNIQTALGKFGIAWKADGNTESLALWVRLARAVRIGLIAAQ